MIVRPEEMRARSAPSTSPLNICETKLAQLITRSSAVSSMNERSGEPLALSAAHAEKPAFSASATRRRPWRRPSGVVAELAPESVRLLHQRLARNDFEDLPIVLLVLHVARLLAAHDDDRAHALMIFRTVMHVTDERGKGLALLVLLDDVGRIEATGLGDHAGPMREAEIAVRRAPFRLVAVFLVEGFDEHLGERILVFERPPEIGGRVDALHDLRADLLRQERDLVGHDEGHLRQEAELLGLLDRQHRVAAPVHVDEELSARVGDVREVLAEILRAER